jgi:uncharacterized membrane protein
MADQLPPVDGTTPQKPSRWMRVILFVSLALNIAILSIALGFFVQGGGKPKGPPRGYQIALGPFGLALDRTDRRDIRRALQANDDSRPLTRAEMQSKATDLLESFRNDPFDPEETISFFADVRARSNTVQETVQQALIDKIIAMSPTDRAAFADRILQNFERNGPKKK